MQSTMNSQRRLRCCLLGHALKLGTRQIYNNLTKIQHISVSVGLTPAHTGNTSMRISAVWGFSAHPRAYGENDRKAPHESRFYGSPPRIRGIPTHRAAGRNLGRLIPAHTGNTRAWLCRVCSPPAHPRAYREYPAISMTGDSSLGSSPHIRGTRAGKGFGLLSRGLIPAHTGNT